MSIELTEAFVWLVRMLLVAGLGWGAWLSIGWALPRSEARVAFEHFATVALLVLLFGTLGGLIHATG
jgi:hypothetical protein